VRGLQPRKDRSVLWNEVAYFCPLVFIRTRLTGTCRVAVHWAGPLRLRRCGLD
jgi:hypothetical protein